MDEPNDVIVGTNAPIIRGGQLGIALEQVKNSRGRTIKADMIKMTLIGGFAQLTWENDVVFQKELERFVEEALQFHLCLNGVSGVQDESDEFSQVVGEGGGSIKGTSKLLGRVLQKVIGD